MFPINENGWHLNTCFSKHQFYVYCSRLEEPNWFAVIIYLVF